MNRNNKDHMIIFKAVRKAVRNAYILTDEPDKKDVARNAALIANEMGVNINSTSQLHTVFCKILIDHGF